MNLRKLLLISCVFIALCPVHAVAFDEEAVVCLTIADGLSGETVHRVMTDHSGGTWIATNSGINIFNGKQLSVFPLTAVHGRPLEVYDLCESKGQCVYAATDDGLYRIHRGSDHAEKVLPEITHPISLLAVGDTIYIGGEQGLMVYDGKQLHHQDVDVSRKGIDNIVRQYAQGDDGLIWFLGRFDLSSYDPKTGKTQRYALNIPIDKMILTQFAPIGRKRFVVGTHGGGLYLCDLAKGVTEQISGGVGNIISAVCRSSDGSVCVATDGAGAFLLDGETLEVREHFSTEGDGRHHLPSNGTYCYYRDPNGVN